MMDARDWSRDSCRFGSRVSFSDDINPLELAVEVADDELVAWV